MNTPRRPLVPAVPGPNSPSNSGSIAQRAVAVREETAARSAPLGATLETQRAAALEPAPYIRYAPVPTPSIHKAVANVMANIGTIEKRGRNKFHGYPYARMEDLLEKATPLMGRAGLAIYQSETGIQNIENNRLAIVYEFVVGHESGEERPPQRQTGVSMARDSKGNFDDKAVAKCHTNARKYFLLSLFQVPAGDFPDSDDDAPSDANQRKEPVPGPGAKQSNQEQVAAQDESAPHVITVEAGATADTFASRYLKAIGQAKSRAEIAEWEKLNDKKLQRIYEGYRSIYDMIGAAVDRRLSDLEAPKEPSSDMPDPKADAQEAMNWVAAQLQQFQEYDAGETFWNDMVAPREADFDEVDWGMLVAEWQRFETKFPQQDPPAA